MSSWSTRILTILNLSVLATVNSNVSIDHFLGVQYKVKHRLPLCLHYNTKSPGAVRNMVLSFAKAVYAICFNADDACLR